ncbi:uncharacterized protein LOC142220822 [Haematobia irritans]|uniref:uncharacterized protein LOC142220822 n=1 Tax=Haematobia irritans TaxID=7368 RepID=UPI003F508B7E
MRKAQKMKVQAIQKEQLQLVQIEKSLESLLGNINESINTLKVEELQLKSSLVELITKDCYRTTEPAPSTSSRALTATPIDWDDCPVPMAPTVSKIEKSNNDAVAMVTTSDTNFLDESINKQLLDLESLVVQIKSKSNMEEEEDESDENDAVHGFEEFLPE